MKKFKILIIICLFFITVCSFSACGVKNNSATPNLTDADVIEVVQIDLDLNKIEGADDSGVANVKNEIRNVAKIICEQMNVSLNNKIDKQLANNDIGTETKEILMSYKNGIQFKDLDFKLNGNIIRYEFCVKYKDVDLYKYYYNETDIESYTLVQDHKLFYDKVKIVGDETALKYYQFSTNCIDEISFKFSNVVNSCDNYMVFNLETSKRRLKTNSNYSMKLSSGNYLHTWIVEDDAEKEVDYYYHIANRSNWIMLALGITSVVLVVLFIISKNIKENNSNTNGENKLINKIITNKINKN